MRDVQRLFDRGAVSEFLLVAAICLLVTAVLLARTDLLSYEHPDFTAEWDHHKYIAMAEDGLTSLSIAPFCWRIVTPTIAAILPFSLPSSFLLISFLSVCFTGVAVYYLVKASTFDTESAVIGMLMFFSLAWATKFVLHDFWLPDALAGLMITTAIYCLICDRKIGYLLAVTFGVGVKESVLFVAPLSYTLRAKQAFDIRNLLRALYWGLPPVVALVAIRVWLPASDSDYQYWTRLIEVGTWRLQNLSPGDLNAYWLGTFGAMVGVLPFLALRENLRLYLKFLPFHLLVYTQLLFATNTERLLVIGFPMMILFAVNGVRAVSARLNVPVRYFLPMPALFILLNLLHRGRGRPAQIEVQAIVLVIYFAAVFVGFARRPDRDRSAAR